MNHLPFQQIRIFCTLGLLAVRKHILGWLGRNDVVPSRATHRPTNKSGQKYIIIEITEGPT